MKIRFLTENTVYRRGLLGEHGLSLLIEEGDKKFLFDTGQSDVFLRNAKKLKEDLSNLDGIILSHGHYDHCGGMEALFDVYDEKKDESKIVACKDERKDELGIVTCNGEGIVQNIQRKPPVLYVREGAFRDKRHLKGENYAVIGIDWKKEDYPGQVIETGEKYEICEGFTLLGRITGETDFEPNPEGFYICCEGEITDREESNSDLKKKDDSKDRMAKYFQPDLMEDEQLLVVEAEKGLFVFMGCSHMGVINCIKRVEKEFPGRHIHTILAGMHLKGASKKRVEQTIEALKEIDFDYLIPVHCTGITAIAAMKEALGERCLLAEVGKKIVI